MPGKRLLFLGDSLIEFCDWREKFPANEVIRLGRPGETVEGLLARLAGDIKGLAQPDIVILMAGTNNVAMEDYFFLESYEKIIQALADKFPTARILINSLLPFRLPGFDDSVIPRVNLMIRRMTDRTKAEFLDIYRLFITEETENDNNRAAQYFQADNVHLSEQGYNIWAGAITKAVGLAPY